MGEKSKPGGWTVAINICPVCQKVHRGNSRWCEMHKLKEQKDES